MMSLSYVLFSGSTLKPWHGWRCDKREFSKNRRFLTSLGVGSTVVLRDCMAGSAGSLATERAVHRATLKIQSRYLLINRVPWVSSLVAALTRGRERLTCVIFEKNQASSRVLRAPMRSRRHVHLTPVL